MSIHFTCVLLCLNFIVGYIYRYVEFSFIIGGWWKAKKFEDITGNVAIEIGDSRYVSAIDNGTFRLGAPRDQGEYKKKLRLSCEIPFNKFHKYMNQYPITWNKILKAYKFKFFKHFGTLIWIIVLHVLNNKQSQKAKLSKPFSFSEKKNKWNPIIEKLFIKLFDPSGLFASFEKKKFRFKLQASS